MTTAFAATDKTTELPLTGLDQAFSGFLQETQPSSDSRHGLLAALTSHQYGRGHACLDLELLDACGVGTLGWEARLQSLLPAALSDVASTLPWITGDCSPLVLDGHRLYLRRNWSAEQSISAAIHTRLQQTCAVSHHLSASLDLLFATSRDSPTQKDTEPDWQKVACALAARSRFTLITGGPGTGKTTTVVRLLAALQSGATQSAQPLRIALAAPTGKAAARLGESIASAIELLPAGMRGHIPTQAVTLHKLLKIRPNQRHEPAPELAFDVVVVDEASMIDLEMMARLLAAVPLAASLILLGDKDQLASVEAGAVMGQLCEGAVQGSYTPQTIDWLKEITGANLNPWAANGSALAQQTVMLRQSRRFSDDSGIGLWAKAVNSGNVAAVQALWRQTPVWSLVSQAKVERLSVHRSSDRHFLALIQQGWQPCLTQIQHAHQNGCSNEQGLKILKALAQFQVLCAVREGPWGVTGLNRLIAGALGFQDEGWYAGRPVMVIRNDYNLKLMNGDVGICLPHPNGLRVAFPDGHGGVVWVLPSRLDAVESVFAMTVHKSQGSEFSHVCLVLPDKAVAVLTRELLYTGITRAKSRLSLIASHEEVLWGAVEAKVLRSGGLTKIHQT